MTLDEQQIRDLIANWITATVSGDLNRILSLMAEDVVFLIPGQPPMRGRDAFAANFQTATQHARIQPESDIQEIRVEGHMAYCWNHLTVTVTPVAGGDPKQRSGHVLSVFRKENGSWVLARDANLVT